MPANQALGFQSSLISGSFQLTFGASITTSTKKLLYRKNVGGANIPSKTGAENLGISSGGGRWSVVFVVVVAVVNNSKLKVLILLKISSPPAPQHLKSSVDGFRSLCNNNVTGALFLFCL